MYSPSSRFSCLPKFNLSVLPELILSVQNARWRDFSSTQLHIYTRKQSNSSLEVLAEHRLLNKIDDSDYLPMEQ